MRSGGARDWRGIGCVALAAASVAFPLGIIVGSRGPAGGGPGAPASRSSSAGQAPPARNVYSPRVGGDPFVIEQQLKVVEALELSCRQYKRQCPEAGRARLRIEEAKGR